MSGASLNLPIWFGEGNPVGGQPGGGNTVGAGTGAPNTKTATVTVSYDFA